MSDTITVLGFEFKQLTEESMLDSMTNMCDGYVIAIHPETNLVTVREGKLKRNLKLYTALHELRNVYFYRTHRRGNYATKSDEVTIGKGTLQMAFLGDLDDDKINKSRLREILRYKQLFPHIYRKYVAAIPDLEKRIEREKSKELVEA